MDKYHDIKMKSYGPNVQIKKSGPSKTYLADNTKSFYFN
jgi:hypothetical protein